jgi:hypothetical protein
MSEIGQNLNIIDHNWSVGGDSWCSCGYATRSFPKNPSVGPECVHPSSGGSARAQGAAQLAEGSRYFTTSGPADERPGEYR